MLRKSHKKLFQPLFIILFLFLFFFTAFTSLAAHPDASFYEGSLGVETKSTYTRLKLSIGDAFKPQFAETKNGFLIKIPAATFLDVGINYEEEKTFKKYLENIEDQRLTNIKVSEKDGTLWIEGSFTFPKGPNSYAYPQMEHIDFRHADERKYIVDFWYKKGPTVAEVEIQKKKDAIQKHKAEQDEINRKEAERSAAREKRLNESKNALLFCDLPFDRSNAVFLKFHSSHPMLNFFNYFPESIPDHRFEYTEPKGEFEEAQMVRLALSLSRDNKHGLVVKTIEFLEKEYPKSKYRNQMLFLKASCYYRLELIDQGRETLLQVAKLARGTDLGVQAAAFLAVQAFQRKEWLAAFNAFMTIKRENPQHPLLWLFRYGIAESLYKVRQHDQAKNEYEWVSKNAPKALIRAEAASKIGDVYFDRNQYALAIGAYANAIKNFESSLAEYPHPILNLAESYFQLEEYAKSQETFQKYLSIARSQPNAWRASLRTAEGQALKQKNVNQSELAFTETVNSYPRTPGAVIARLRLLPCGNHGGFDLAGAQRFLTSPEVKDFDGGGDLYTSSFKELVGLSEVRTLLSFSQDEKAIERGIVHLRENPSVEVRNLIEQVMIGGIKRLLQGKLDKADGYGAIATFEKYGDYLPLPSHDPATDELRIRIAKFASEKKLSTFALKLIEPYRKMNEADHRELMVAIEKNLALESTDEQDNRNYIEVKTLWNSDTLNLSNEKECDLFLTRLAAIRDQSNFAWERDLLKALYFQQKKNPEKALEIAEKLVGKVGRHGMDKLNAAQKSQVWFWFASLAKDLNRFEIAAKGFREARKSSKTAADLPDIGIRHFPSIPSIVSLYANEGEMLERQQNWKESVALYTEAIENKVGGNHLLYAHARALLRIGGKVDGREAKVVASQSLEKIKQSQDDDVWKKLAQNALDEIAKEGKVNDNSRKP